jgi:4-hydroxyphenylpyruvate dioxygenase
VDGKPGELLLQIFSENQLGPIFFEFIQRKGNEGFGEGNFKALFETMELDQMRRGVSHPDGPAPGWSENWRWRRRTTRVSGCGD